MQGVFLHVFKKLKAAFKKLKLIFGKKLNAMEAILGIQKKTQFFWQKYPEFIQKFVWFSIYL